MNKKLKKVLLILFLIIFGLNLNGQNLKGIDISIHQDTKFTFVGDERGNTAFTLDALIHVEIPIYRFSKSYLTLYPSIEYADLKGGILRRYSFGFGYVIEDIYLKKLNLSIHPNYGFINRLGNNTNSAGINFEVYYKLTEWFSLSYIHQITERTDLTALYNDNDTIRNSSFIGIIFHL